MSSELALESQGGDPALPEETLSLYHTQIDELDRITAATGLESPAQFAKKDAGALFAQQLLATASAEADAGVSRRSNQPRVTEYLKLLGLDFADENGTPYPFCAAGVSWATAKSFCDLAPTIPYGPETRLGLFRSLLQPLRAYYFRPDARCQTIENDSKARGLWVSETATPKPGWLILYNWHRKSTPQHIGIVQSADATSLHTIEFNTSPDDGPNQGNGGFVARKNRQPFRWAVLGYVKTYDVPAGA
ncbi:CHAP domain-containing protein [Bradyrhizobium sp. URHD0069]|uniref:CHAP domain-containing protein n=1 Tax=Bradyrhizobium sp. URHD0069 TaxID=1380355 RepID=UPI000AF39E27|nr:CHAP domain-containing protein [Bradyrhizobium sp. URHD0069]